MNLAETLKSAIQDPLILGLSIAWFLTSCIQTWQKRVMQRHKSDSFSLSEMATAEHHREMRDIVRGNVFNYRGKVIEFKMGWINLVVWINIFLLVALVYLNWQWTLLLYVVGFILAVLPVLESIGALMSRPFYRVGSETEQAEQDHPVLTESEAVEITAGFGEIWADCIDERLLLKPESRLPASFETISEAFKVSYQQGYPFDEKLENSHRVCYSQLAFFIPDEGFERAIAYFARLEQAISEERHHPAMFDVRGASADLSSAPMIARHSEPFEGQEFTGAKLVENMDNRFENEFLSGAPDDPDKEWVREAVLGCWQLMRLMIEEWEEFATLVAKGESGLEPKELSLARIETNKSRNKINDFIENIGNPESIGDDD